MMALGRETALTASVPGFLLVGPKECTVCHPAEYHPKGRAAECTRGGIRPQSVTLPWPEIRE